MKSIPFVSMCSQLSRAMETLQISDMKSVEHEDKELNNDYSVDPLADPRLDKMDLYNMVSPEDRDKVMNAQSSFAVADGDSDNLGATAESAVDSTSESGSGE